MSEIEGDDMTHNKTWLIDYEENKRFKRARYTGDLSTWLKENATVNIDSILEVGGHRYNHGEKNPISSTNSSSQS